MPPCGGSDRGDGRGNFFGILDKRIEFPEVSPVLSSGRIAPVDEIAIIFLAGAVVVTGILAAGTDGRGAEHRPRSSARRGSRPPRRRPPNNETTVWQIDQKGNSDGIHPTQKPLEIFARPIRWHTARGELCYEPFGGSGTCLIAAALEGRRCFAMELSPGFCDVIRKRWGDYARSAGVEPGEGAL